MRPHADANARRVLCALVLMSAAGWTGCLRFGYDVLNAAPGPKPDAGFDAGSSAPPDGGKRALDASSFIDSDAGKPGTLGDASAALDASADAAAPAADSGGYVGSCRNQLPAACRLDIAASQVIAGPHASFPLLVSLRGDWLRSAAMGGSVADARGADLRFSQNSSGAGTLPFDIESYDPAAGSLLAWVHMPTLDSGSVLYLLFGPCAAQLPAAGGSVWQDYSAVWHLGDNRDSTGQSADAVEESSSVPTAAGQIGSGRAFTPAGGALNTGSSTAIDDVFASGGFISAWINASTSSSGAAGRIASKVVPFSLNSNGWALLLDPNPSGSLVFRYYFSPSVGYWVTPAGTLPLGGWHMVFLQYSSASATANPEIFVDGQLIGLGNGSAPSGSAVSDASSPMYIGNMGDGSRAFDGTIDELRLARGARSAGWIATEYNNQRDPAGFFVVTPP